ncbi:MAG: ABC transporter ATP-binding protein [Microthrixaceae bacterium]
MNVPDRALLEVSGIQKRFAGIVALNNVDLRVHAGEFSAVIGPNGAGKSTLFNCLTGVLAPDAGTVTLDGIPLTTQSASQRARMGIGRTFQRVELFGGMTVLDHLVVADRARYRSGAVLADLFTSSRPSAPEMERAHDVMDLLGIEDEADSAAESLPLGRARLVELARALMTQPRLLFLDEPSSGLDRSETAEMAEVLRAVCDDSGTAVVLIEHDVDLVAELAETVWVLDYGQLIASGPTGTVFADEKVRSAYLGATT